MPPRSRSTQKKPLDDDDADVVTGAVPASTATVSDIADARVDLDLDAELERVEDLDPFTFRLDGREWTVQPPGIAQILDAEQAPYLSDFFEIVMGEELWNEFEPVFREQTKPALTWKLARGMSQAFKMDPVSVQEEAERDMGANRAARRGNRARPRRR